MAGFITRTQEFKIGAFWQANTTPDEREEGYLKSLIRPPRGPVENRSRNQVTTCRLQKIGATTYTMYMEMQNGRSFNFQPRPLTKANATDSAKQLCILRWGDAGKQQQLAGVLAVLVDAPVGATIDFNQMGWDTSMDSSIVNPDMNALPAGESSNRRRRPFGRKQR